MDRRPGASGWTNAGSLLSPDRPTASAGSSAAAGRLAAAKAWATAPASEESSAARIARASRVSGAQLGEAARVPLLDRGSNRQGRRKRPLPCQRLGRQQGAGLHQGQRDAAQGANRRAPGPSATGGVTARSRARPSSRDSGGTSSRVNGASAGIRSLSGHRRRSGQTGSASSLAAPANGQSASSEESSSHCTSSTVIQQAAFAGGGRQGREQSPRTRGATRADLAPTSLPHPGWADCSAASTRPTTAPGIQASTSTAATCTTASP